MSYIKQGQSKCKRLNSDTEWIDITFWGLKGAEKESDFLIPYLTNNALICFQDLQQSVFNAEMIEEQSLEVNMVHLLHILWNNEIT